MNKIYSGITGAELEIDFFKIKPKTMRDILQIGEDEYFRKVGLLTIEPKLQLKDLPKEMLDKVTDYELFLQMCKMNESIGIEYVDALNYFCPDAGFVLIQGLIGTNTHLFNSETFLQVRDFILKEHLIELDPARYYQSANSKADEIKRKIEENKRIVAKSKNKKKEHIGLEDHFLSFIVVDKSYMLETAQNLTYYQFLKMLKKHQIVENYDLGIKQLLAGADPKKVDVKHWLETK